MEKIEILILKIGRHEYTITSEDRFIDNGSTVQLLTQSKLSKIHFSDARAPNPVLSKRAIKQINSMKQRTYTTTTSSRVFGIVAGDE